mmetsp:Transcript_69472/g.125254  ORF Transcript_69472/g.125254 Transcript_69472/m.125254 type:complete len:231 (+) Transcript_69472:384-1076(+)
MGIRSAAEAAATGATGTAGAPALALLARASGPIWSRAISSRSFWTSEDASTSSLSSRSASSMASSASAQRAISLLMASIVPLTSGILAMPFIFRMMSAERRMEEVVLMVAMEVVSCRFTACMEALVFSRRCTALRDLTTDLASICTASTLPFSAWSWISRCSFASSTWIFLISRSRVLTSVLSCHCHSLACNFVLMAEFLFPIATKESPHFQCLDGAAASVILMMPGWQK